MIRAARAVAGSEVGRFAVVGLAAYATDVAVFNLLRLGMDTEPIAAKVLSGAAAIAVAFAGSRWWTWRSRPRGRLARESVLFVVMSVLAAGIQVACLLVSRQVLGLLDPVSDNIAANVVGMALATVFRFWAFRTVVFRAPPGEGPDDPTTAGSSDGPPDDLRAADGGRPARAGPGARS